MAPFLSLNVAYVTPISVLTTQDNVNGCLAALSQRCNDIVEGAFAPSLLLDIAVLTHEISTLVAATTAVVTEATLMKHGMDRSLSRKDSRREQLERSIAALAG